MLLTSQYAMVLSSRDVLFEYCANIHLEDFVRSSSNFGRGGSIRSLMVHICNTYQGWLGEFASESGPLKYEYDSVPTFKDCQNYFSLTDKLVLSFIEKFQENYLIPLEIDTGANLIKTTPLQLFTHTITHEFHHKGQILSLSRLWGYTPVDTDIMR